MKKQQQLKARTTWGFSPVTRVVPSKKRYKRQDQKRVILKHQHDHE